MAIAFCPHVNSSFSDLQAAIPWPSAVETPTVWVRGLTRQPFWDCHKAGCIACNSVTFINVMIPDHPGKDSLKSTPQAWPFVRHLEAQFSRILSEAVLAAPKLEKAEEKMKKNTKFDRISPWNNCSGILQYTVIIVHITKFRTESSVLPFAAVKLMSTWF